MIDSLFDFSVWKLVLAVVLFIISSIAKSECDTIKFRPHKAWFQTDFWLERKNPELRGFLLKYPLSFAYGGWHLMDSTRNTCYIIQIFLWFAIPYYWFILIIVISYMLYGLIFELFYQN